MIFNRVIPSLLLSKKRLVKGINFKNHRDAGSPPSTIRSFNHQGADEIMLLDIDCSISKKEPDYESFKQVAKESFIPLTFGGGISNLKIAEKYFECGADKICLGTSALDNPNLITELSQIYGRQAVVINIDLIKIDNSYKIYNFAKKVDIDLDIFDWIKKIQDLGAGEIKLTSVNKEGLKNNYDFEMINKYNNNIDIPLIVEGGFGNLNHIKDCFENNINSIALGSMLIFSDFNLVKINKYLSSEGLHVRK